MYMYAHMYVYVSDIGSSSFYSLSQRMRILPLGERVEAQIELEKTFKNGPCLFL